MRTRYIPTQAKEIKNDELNIVIYAYKGASGDISAVAYSGRRTKPDFQYRYTSEEQREQHITKYLNAMAERITQQKANKQARLKALKESKHSLKIGDILYTSWGYDQTNVDFYEVTAVKSDKTVVIREIAATTEGRDGFSSMSGFSTPIKGNYIGDPMVKVARDGRVKIDTHIYATLWNGKPRYTSWYA